MSDYIEVQFSISRMNTILQNALHECFLAINVFDSPDTTPYLIHHVEIPDMSFAASEGSVVATVNPLLHLVRFADVIANPNQVAPATQPVTLALEIIFVGYRSNTSTPLPMLSGRMSDVTVSQLGDLPEFLTDTQLGTLTTALNSYHIDVDLLQFFSPPELISGLAATIMAVSVDAQHFSVRQYIDANLQDPDYRAFVGGTITDRLHGKDWSSFISQDLITAFVNAHFQQMFGVTVLPIPWLEPTYTWVASPPSVQVSGPGVDASLVFELAPYVLNTPQGGTIQLLRIGTTFPSRIPGTLPAGAKKVSPNEFVQDIAMAQIDVLEAQGACSFVSGAADGLEMGGSLTPSPLQDADFTLLVKPFSWSWYEFCSDHRRVRTSSITPQDEVNAHASASLGPANQPGVNRPITVWYLRQYTPHAANQPPAPADPLDAFGPYLSMPAEGSSVTSVVIDLSITAKDFLAHHANYWAAPYPCTLLCVTSAGAIYLTSLGEVPPLQVDAQTGQVLNVPEVYVHDCYFAVKSWHLFFNNYNPIWSIDPYVGEAVERLAATSTAGQVIRATLGGLQPGEPLLLTAQDRAAQTSERVLLADRSGTAEVLAYLPLSANPTPLRVTRILSDQPLRVAQMERTLLTQITRLPLSAPVERVVGAVAHARPLLQVVTAAGEQTFDLSDPGRPLSIQSGRLSSVKHGFLWRLIHWGRREPAALPAGLTRIGDGIVVAVDARRNSVVIFQARTRQEDLRDAGAATPPTPLEQASLPVVEASAPTRSVLIPMPR